MTVVRDLIEKLSPTGGREQSSEETNSSGQRAAIYARTSSVSQRFGYSIDEQVRQCLDRCHMLGWNVHFLFKDEAVSGKDTDRPMFQEMLSNAERGRFDVLVFWKLDRFSRSIMHAVQLEKQFRDWDVALYSITEQIDTTTPAGRFNFRNIANAAEFERELIKQRTKMGHTALAMDHKWPNKRPPLGYERSADGRLRTHPREASLVRWIFKVYLENRSMPKVAKELNASRCSTRSGKKWTPGRISAILRNQIYIGEYSVGEIDEPVPEYQILNRELFERATDVRNRFQTPRESRRPPMGLGRKRRTVEDVVAEYSKFQALAGSDSK